MNGFVYFLPGHASHDLTGVSARCGPEVLGVFAGAKPAVTLGVGPEGEGALFTLPEVPPERRRYAPEEQTWRKAPPPPGGAPGALWVGMWNDARPGPEDLARPDLIDGHAVALGDNGRWRVPLARVFPAGTALPEKLILGADGLEREVRPEFVALSKATEEIWEAFLASLAGDGAGKMPYERLWRVAADALAVNYRIGTAGCNLLALFDTGNLLRVARALADVPTFETWLREEGRKKELTGAAAPAGPSTSGGAPGSAPATSPPSLTSG